MYSGNPQRHDEVDQLLRNAELRDALEPFLDDSISRLNVSQLPTSRENEYLASMLAWERAPVVPISKWFTPELRPPHPDSLPEPQLRRVLWETVRRLFEMRIVLDFTDHLSDRHLYCLIYRDILPSPEKKIDDRQTYLHWDCAGGEENPEVWLRYYATEEERRSWADSGFVVPPAEPPPYPRQLPRRPL